jgi:anti-sigma regulatory factor (Ser/Thr protein kinase)
MLASCLFADIPIEDMASATVARRVAGELAMLLGFPQSRKAEAVLVTSELAHNHVMHHTVHGLIRLSGFYASAIPCLSISSLDQGPGFDPAVVGMRHRKNIAGCGLGAGMGTVLRLSDRLDIFSHMGRPGMQSPYETIISALLGPDHQANEEIIRIGGSLAILSQSRGGEGWGGGDGVHVQQDGRYSRITIVDSLGLGQGAAEITSRVFTELDRHSLFWPPANLLEEVEFALAETNGAAVHVLLFDRVKGLLSSAGIGNIATLISLDGELIEETDPAGILGHAKWRKITGQEYKVLSGVRVSMHTDGQKRIADLSADFSLSPAVIAQMLFEPLTPQRDDATLVTWQWPEKSTNHYT